MEHFNIILAICRMAAQTPSKALITQMTRLKKSLEEQGALKEAQALAKVIEGSSIEEKLVPSRLTLSKAQLDREEQLIKTIKPPVDKESGNPLAEIIIPDHKITKPLFDVKFDKALDLLIREWSLTEELKSQNINTPMSCLIYGAPGTGKTKTAFYIANQLKLPVIIAKLDGLISSFLGTTARNISNLFEFAKRHNAILLLDEFDAIAKLRDDPHELGEIKRVVNTLLQCIDSRAGNGYTIAITNHEKLLDTAVWRRFDSRIYVPKPNQQTRNRILEQYLGAHYPEPVIEFLNWLSEDFSGADIEALCNNIIRQSILSSEKKNIIDQVRNYIQLNSDMVALDKKSLILGDNDELAFALMSNQNANFNQDMLAALFEKDKSTISRWLRKVKSVSHEK